MMTSDNMHEQARRDLISDQEFARFLAHITGGLHEHMGSDLSPLTPVMVPVMLKELADGSAQLASGTIEMSEFPPPEFQGKVFQTMGEVFAQEVANTSGQAENMLVAIFLMGMAEDTVSGEGTVYSVVGMTLDLRGGLALYRVLEQDGRKPLGEELQHVDCTEDLEQIALVDLSPLKAFLYGYSTASLAEDRRNPDAPSTQAIERTTHERMARKARWN